MYPLTEDDANDVVFEDRAYDRWVREEKNRILRIPNQKRKQEEWRKLFPTFVSDDSWLDVVSDVY